MLLAVPGELMVYEKPLSPERDLVNIHLGRKRRLGGRATTALLPAWAVRWGSTAVSVS
jgi:hypothetical protein